MTSEPRSEQLNNDGPEGGELGKAVRRFWFRKQCTPEQQQGIIDRAFREANPTGDDVRKVVDDFKRDMGT